MKRLLDQRVAIVTGAGSGIGQAIAMAFAHSGARVALLGRTPAKLHLTCDEIMQKIPGAELLVAVADVSQADSFTAALDLVLQTWGRCDVLVNNAGITQDSLLMKMSDEQWDDVLTTNLRSVFVGCRHILRPMLKQRSGSIINISSVSGLMGNPGQCNYAASKAGVVGFSKSLAKEVASRSLRVNVIAPGFIESDMTRALSEPLEARYRETIPLGRFGHCTEIAQVALFLASDMASYMTGQVLSVDGGLFMA